MHVITNRVTSIIHIIMFNFSREMVMLVYFQKFPYRVNDQCVNTNRICVPGVFLPLVRLWYPLGHKQIYLWAIGHFLSLSVDMTSITSNSLNMLQISIKINY